MPHSFGYRGRTRDLFKKGYRQNGTIALSRFQTTYRVGDIVDVKGDGACHKGMPHKFYHGKTGTVWNVTRRAIGVIMHKQVGNRILNKRVHFRIEHVKHSKCRKDFLDRVIANEKLKKEAREKKITVVAKRVPRQPEGAKFVQAKSAVKTLAPLPFVWLA